MTEIFFFSFDQKSSQVESNETDSSSREASFSIDQKSPTTNIKLRKKSHSRRSSSSSDQETSRHNIDTQDLFNQLSENKTRYRVTIYPSHDESGEFNPVEGSRIFLRLNSQTKETNLLNNNDQSCPFFDPNEEQTFELDLIENPNVKPKKLTIGYVNSDPTASTWEIEKVLTLFFLFDLSL